MFTNFLPFFNETHTHKRFPVCIYCFFCVLYSINRCMFAYMFVCFVFVFRSFSTQLDKSTKKLLLKNPKGRGGLDAGYFKCMYFFIFFCISMFLFYFSLIFSRFQLANIGLPMFLLNKKYFLNLLACGAPHFCLLSQRYHSDFRVLFVARNGYKKETLLFFSNKCLKLKCSEI